MTAARQKTKMQTMFTAIHSDELASCARVKRYNRYCMCCSSDKLAIVCISTCNSSEKLAIVGFDACNSSEKLAIVGFGARAPIFVQQ